jgi:hypothetical protein
VAEPDDREQALALVQAGEFAHVRVHIAGKEMLRPRTAHFLVWTSVKPEAERRAHAYCEARGWQLDWSRVHKREWRCAHQLKWSDDRPGSWAGEALSVHLCGDVRVARLYVMRGQYEPLPKQGA